MRTLWVVRSRAETYLLAPMLVLVLIQATAVADTATPEYWISAVAKPGLLLCVIVPVCALCAAVEGLRHRVGRIDALAPARSPIQTALVAVIPTLVMGFIGLAVAIAAVLPVAAGAPGWPDPWPLVIDLLVVASHTVTGYALGRWLPPAVALPASLAGSYLWLAYPAAVEPFWLRHLNGLSLENCCVMDRTLAPRSVLAAGLFACGLGCGVLLALAGTWWAKRAGGMAFATMAVLAAVVAWPLGPSPTVARAGHQRCAGNSPKLCLWPEQERYRQTLQSGLSDGYAHLGQLAQVGLRLPPTVTTREPARSGELFVVFPARPDAPDAIASFVASFVPDTSPACAAQGPWPGAATRPALAVWMALAAGVPASRLRLTVQPELVDLTVEVRALTPDRQLAWYQANLAPMRDCTTEPSLDPAEFARDAQ